MFKKPGGRVSAGYGRCFGAEGRERTLRRRRDPEGPLGMRWPGSNSYSGAGRTQASASGPMSTPDERPGLCRSGRVGTGSARAPGRRAPGDAWRCGRAPRSGTCWHGAEAEDRRPLARERGGDAGSAGRTKREKRRAPPQYGSVKPPGCGGLGAATANRWHLNTGFDVLRDISGWERNR
jgi:hypothetical protein